MRKTIFGVDVGVKYIIFKHHLIQFRYSLWNGITEVKVFENGKEVDVEPERVNPPLREWLPDLWRIYLPRWIKQKVQHKGEKRGGLKK